MAKTSGANRKRGGFVPNDSTYSGPITNVKPLSSIKHNEVYREVKQGIARYHAVLGVRQQEVKLATLNGAIGVHVTSGDGKSKAVYLDTKTFNQTKAKIVSGIKTAYNSGFLTKTNKPIQHAVTHELAHATWNQHLTSPRTTAASREIHNLYRVWMRDTRKTGYGQYGKTNVSEFFSETVTKAVHGTSDRYTRRIKSIIKKYKL